MASRPSDEKPPPASGNIEADEPIRPEFANPDSSLLHTEGKNAGAQASVEVDHNKLGKPHKSAAGIERVRQSLRYVWGRMGVTRGTGALLKLNQIDGFDCQGCAWPSPDERRHVAEFCENGAKALSDEGTRKQ